MRKRHKKIVILAHLSICACLLLSSCGGTKPSASSSATVVKTVSRGDLIVGLTADGTVALPVTNLNFEVDGAVSKIYVAAGDSVKSGDLLAELDGSDYQLTIQTAENSLDKAKTNYDDAVWQYEQGLKSDELSLVNTRKSLDTGFDSYTYLNAITDAEVTLEKRRTELAEARENYNTPYDSLSSDRQIEDAETTLATRLKELEDAKAGLEKPFDSYTYTSAITDAENTVTKRASELSDAEKDTASPYDSTSIDRQIADAQTALNTRQKELDDAKSKARDPFDKTDYDRKIADAEQSLYDKQIAYYNALDADPTDANYFKNADSAYGAYLSAQTTLDRLYEDRGTAESDARKDAETKLDTAQKNYDTAVLALSRLQEDKASGKTTASDSAGDKLKQAQQNLDDAKKALETANRNLEKAESDYSDSIAKALDTAQKNYDSAVVSFTRLLEDADRGVTSSEKDLSGKLATALTNVSDAERSLTRARENYTRAKDEYNISASKNEGSYQLQLEDHERAKLGSITVKNAASAVKDAELALENAHNNLEKIRIYAPIDGEIINISKKTGEKVTANNAGAGGLMVFGTSASSNSFLTICDLSEIYLSANITEGDIIGVEKDQTVRVQVDAIGEETFTGFVQTISSLPTTDSSGITSYAVTIKLDKGNTTIKDGMAALLTFVRLEHTDVLMIPNKAVFIEDNKQYVNVSKSGSYEKREVSCGLTNGSETEVLSGLNEGDSVVVGAIKE